MFSLHDGGYAAVIYFVASWLRGNWSAVIFFVCLWLRTSWSGRVSLRYNFRFVAVGRLEVRSAIFWILDSWSTGIQLGLISLQAVWLL